jgi:predicted ATPase
MLLQQPEVHLHPKAQAALGSFFARLVAETKTEFVIESHSDHLLDRVRQEVARGVIPHDAVKILFFYKPRSETQVFEISLDKSGNVLNAPPEYRAFFLQEELKLLNRTELSEICA